MLFAAETETVASGIGLVIAGILMGLATAWGTFRKTQGEESRKDKEQEEKSLLIVVQQQTTIITDMKAQAERDRKLWDTDRLEIIRRLDAKDKEVKECHDDKLVMYQRLARMEGALIQAGLKFKDDSSLHRPLKETLPDSPSDTRSYGDG